MAQAVAEHAGLSAVRWMHFNAALLERHRPIDRDKLRAWLATTLGEQWNTAPEGAEYEIIETADRVLDTLELDLRQFRQQGDPYQFLKVTRSKD